MDKCLNKRVADMLLAYELGMLSADERQEVEVHLLECHICYQKVQDFSAMSHVLREEPEAQTRISQLAWDDPAPDSTLHKNDSSPEHRWWFYGRLALGVAAAIVIFLLVPWQLEFHPNQEVIATPNTLLILDFDDHLSEDGLGEIVANLLITDLSESEYVRVISTEKLYEIKKRILYEGEPTDSIEFESKIAKYADARWILRGKVIRDQKAIAITSSLFDLNHPEDITTQKVTGQSGNPVFELIDHLTVKIKNDLSLPDFASKEDDPIVADITTYSPEAYAYFVEGLIAAQKLYVSEAITAFEACLEIDSTYAMAYYHLAQLKDRRLIEKAVQFSDHANQRGKYLIRSRESEYLLGCKNHQAILEELLERFPGETESILHQGYHYYIKGEYTEAIKLYKQVLAIDPLSKAAYNSLAYVYNDAGEYKKAIEATDNYIRIAPDEANPYDTQGDIYSQNGKIDEAIISYQTALIKKPDFWSSLKKLGYMNIFKGDYEQAIVEYKKIKGNSEILDQIDIQVCKTYILMRQGKFDDALIMIDSVITGYQEPALSDLYIEPITPHHIKSIIYHEQGYYAKAVAEAETCVSLMDLTYPGNAMNYRWVLANSLAALGDDNRTDSLIQYLREYYQNSDEPPLQLYRSSGVVALAHHDGNQAAELLLKAINGKIASMDFLTHARLGHAYLEAGRFEEAVATLSMVVNVIVEWRLIDGGYGVKAYYYLGQAYEGIGEVDLAVEQYQTFLELWKNADSDINEIAIAKERLVRLQNDS